MRGTKANNEKLTPWPMHKGTVLARKRRMVNNYIALRRVTSENADRALAQRVPRNLPAILLSAEDYSNNRCLCPGKAVHLAPE